MFACCAMTHTHGSTSASTSASTGGERQPLTRYRVKLRTHLDSTWLSQFPVTRLTAGYDAARKPVTTMIVSVRDQSELMGMLLELHGLGLTLLSVQLLAGRRKGGASASGASGA